MPVAPASPRGDGGEAGAGEEAEAATGPEPVELGDRGGGRTAGDIAAERPGLMAGATVEDGTGDAAETLWKDGPVWMVRSLEPELEAARRPAPAERVEQAAEAVRTAEQAGSGFSAVERMAEASARAGADGGVRAEAAGPAFAGARQASTGQSGLEGLYRQTVRAARPAAPALAPEQAGGSVRAREPGDAASLTVNELDRAVRRDSRRYDGGMSIF